MSPKHALKDLPAPPGTSRALRRVAQLVVAPVERILHQQTSSGILLMIAAALALVLANSPLAHDYEHILHTPLGLGVGEWTFSRPLHFWISDFLMTFFFMVAGFEIKREMAQGELSDLRRAGLPIAAAIGGMVIPAAIYFALNPSGPTAAGWGVPMATDIAFALGVLMLLGSRVPSSLRILLLALAIIDDLGAILVIAVFYSSGFTWTGALVIGVGLGVLVFFIRAGVRPGWIYLVPLIILWSGLLGAGIHPTIAGVIVGVSAPARSWLSHKDFRSLSEKSIAEFSKLSTDPDVGEEALVAPLRRLSIAGREAVAPVVRLQVAFHPWVAFAIMPLFALANAGVNLGGLDFEHAGAMPVTFGIALGLALGKPLGVVGVSWLMVRLGVLALPRGVTWSGMLVLGLCAGIGFTMSIFIANLAFEDPAVLAVAKLSILAATIAASVIALVLGRLLLSPSLDPDVAATSPAAAEGSTEY